VKKSAALLALVFITTLALAEEPRVRFTGEDYMVFTKRERLEAMKNFKANARKSGIVIKKDPLTYCRLMDAFYVVHPDFLKESVSMVLKTLAIMEYDWQEKGANKDKLAHEWLGDELYQANKKRLEKE